LQFSIGLPATDLVAMVSVEPWMRNMMQLGSRTERFVTPRRFGGGTGALGARGGQTSASGAAGAGDCMEPRGAHWEADAVAGSAAAAPAPAARAGPLHAQEGRSSGPCLDRPGCRRRMPHPSHRAWVPRRTHQVRLPGQLVRQVVAKNEPLLSRCAQDSLRCARSDPDGGAPRHGIDAIWHGGCRMRWLRGGIR
jgi:hypothetical protein